MNLMCSVCSLFIHANTIYYGVKVPFDRSLVKVCSIECAREAGQAQEVLRDLGRGHAIVIYLDNGLWYWRWATRKKPSGELAIGVIPGREASSISDTELMQAFQHSHGSIARKIRRLAKGATWIKIQR